MVHHDRARSAGLTMAAARLDELNRAPTQAVASRPPTDRMISVRRIVAT